MKLDYLKLKHEYDEITQKLVLPIIAKEEFEKLSKRRHELEQIIPKIDQLSEIKKKIIENETFLKGDADPELIMIAEDELINLKRQKEKLDNEIIIELMPKDPDEDKNVILEIRPAAGGEEASLFAAQLLRMYNKYAEKKKWKVTLLEQNVTDVGGIKESIIEIKGKHTYNNFKYESGVHRVQRVPKTEKVGRVHTSTVTVAVLPEVDEADIVIKPEDLKIETYRAGGHGGQNVQKTESAVRITHLPTGIVAQSQDERSQNQNRERALKVLRSRVYQEREEKKAKERGSMRKIQIGTGDRSEKIRTYNFPQDRLTDHRINFSLKNLEHIMEGNLDDLIEKLKETDLEVKIKNLSL